MTKNLVKPNCKHSFADDKIEMLLKCRFLFLIGGPALSPLPTMF